MGVGPSAYREGKGQGELRRALRACRGAFLALAFVSAVINVLYLTGSVYMLEVYDRVLASRSVPTLVAISILAAALYGFQAALDVLRGRVLTRVGNAVDNGVSERVHDVIVRTPLRRRVGGDGLQPLRDLDQVRGFLASGGPTALFDLPWLPFYLGICFLFHFWIGMTALIGALVLIAVTILTDVMTRSPARETVSHGAVRFALAEQARRNAEALHALGMAGRIATRWSAANAAYLSSQTQAADVTSSFGALGKVLRMMLQSAVLGVGAYLVILQEASAGVIIAGSILSARALAPAELAIANWKGFVAARQSWRRLEELLESLPPQPALVALPAPGAAVSVETLGVAPPGSLALTLADVTFSLKAGQGLGVIGPSGAGKSTLARALVGVWAPVRGHVRLDGAALDQWTPDALGAHLGYLPQDVELLEGTIAENIARFRPDAPASAIIAAAKAADVHDLILRQPAGYDTRLGEGGIGLSAGQRQRIGLARALFGDPFLVVLDEPNSNLDAEGDAALTRAIAGVRRRGGVAIVIAHRPSALAAVDMALLLVDGTQRAFGPKEAILAKLVPPAQAAGAGAGAQIRLVSEGREGDDGQSRG
jgi:PrtD family type I secretion system ABC transporter